MLNWIFPQEICALVKMYEPGLTFCCLQFYSYWLSRLIKSRVRCLNLTKTWKSERECFNLDSTRLTSPLLTLHPVEITKTDVCRQWSKSKISKNLLPFTTMSFEFCYRKQHFQEAPQGMEKHVESHVLIKEFSFVSLFSAVLFLRMKQLKPRWWRKTQMLSGALRIDNLEGQRKCGTPCVCAFIRSQSKRLLMSSVGVCLCVNKSVVVCAWFSRCFFLSQWAVKIRVCPVNLCQPKTHLLWVPLSTAVHLTSAACLSVLVFFWCIMCRQAWLLLSFIQG